MFLQTARQAYGQSLARYQDVVPAQWQEHGNGQLSHSRTSMSEFGNLVQNASEIEFAGEQYYSNYRFVSPPPSSHEDAFDQNTLILPTNSQLEAPVPYSSLSSRIRRQNVDILKQLPHARFERVSVNEEDDAFSKPLRSDTLTLVSSREEKFKEHGKLTMKRKAIQVSEPPLAPPCKRVSSGASACAETENDAFEMESNMNRPKASKTILCQTKESDEQCPSSNDRNGNQRSQRGPATDPQSVYARHRRERINERLKILQKLVPNGAKVDISTMLEEAISYVKFLQLQVKFLSSDEYWMYTPIAYNGIDFAFNIQNSA